MISILCDKDTLTLVNELIFQLFYQENPKYSEIGIYSKLSMEEFEYEFPYFTQKRKLNIRGTDIHVYFGDEFKDLDIDDTKDILFIKSLFLD
jgi:hypothetical protein